MLTIPALDGLSWSSVRALARELAAAQVDEVYAAVLPLLSASDAPHRMLAVYLLGYLPGDPLARLATLRAHVPPDLSWEVQEALAQAFDACCAALGYAAALPVIDAWLADAHPNARRAVSEGLRPWTSKRRDYFARQPAEAIRRLAALRHDPSAYVRHSAGNALRDIRRAHPALMDGETATWDFSDPLQRFTFERVQRAR
jgi:DNA alkylation repair enzyme